MTDNELFNHFKSQSSCYDEIPGNALWAKIENGLKNDKPAAKQNTLLAVICGLVLVTAIVLYAIFTTDKEDKLLPAPPQPKAETVVEKPVTTITDSVKKIHIKIINTSEKKTIPFAQIIKKDSVKQNITAPKTIEIKVQTPPGKVIVTTTQQLTREEFKELTENITEQHKTESGTMIIIKAPGYKPFRKVITAQDALLQPDSINLIQPGPIKLIPSGSINLLKTDSLTLKTDGKSLLTPETIHFIPKKDSPKATAKGRHVTGSVIVTEELDSL